MAILLEEATTSFARGMLDSASPAAFPEDAAALIQNGRVLPDATVERRDGSRKAHSAALNSGAVGRGAAVFRTAAGTEQWVIFVGDRMLYSTDEGSTWTNPAGATGLTQDEWSTTTFQQSSTNYLLCANGGTNSYSWDGTTWATISNIPNSVKYLQTHNERLWASDGTRLYASKIQDFSTWASPDGIDLPVLTHDGDTEVTGLFSLGGILLVFKRQSVAYVEGYGNSDVIVAAGTRGISRSVGCIAFRTIMAVGDQAVAWLSDRGVELYVPGAGIRLVSDGLQEFFRSIAWGEIVSDPGLPVGIWHPYRHEIRIALPSVIDRNTVEFVYNTVLGCAYLFQHAAVTGFTVYEDSDGYMAYQEDTARSLVRLSNGYVVTANTNEAGVYVGVDDDGYMILESADHNHAALFIADRTEENATPNSVGYDGFVRYLEKGDTDNADVDGSGGESITMRLRTRPLLFGARHRRKRGRRLRVLASSASASTVTALVRADGVDGTTHSLSYSATTDNQPTQEKARVNARAFALQPEVRSTDKVRVSGVSLAAEVLADRL